MYSHFSRSLPHHYPFLFLEIFVIVLISDGKRNQIQIKSTMMMMMMIRVPFNGRSKNVNNDTLIANTNELLIDSSGLSY